MNNIKSDQDGFLLPKKEADQIQTILDNTETLLARQAPHRRAVTVSIKQPKPPVQNKPQPVAVVRAPEPPREKPNVRPTPMQRRAEKDRAAAAREQRRQTRILESIAENRGGKKGGGLLSGLGMGAGVLKGLMRAPANFAKGAARRGTDGRFMPAGKGRGLPRLGGLIKGMGKGGALAVVGGLFGGLQIEQSGMSRPDKNKAHAKNLVGVGGGLAGAAAGAKLGALAGSVVPGAGTVLGGLLGGALGALAGTQLADYATDRLDKAIDPQLSRNMFSSWRGFTNGAAGLWNSFTANTNARWKSFSETAQAGWNDFSGSLKTASLHVWQEMLPKKFTDYFADLGSWGKSAWGKFSEQSASYWDSVKSFAQSAWQGLSAAAAPYVEQAKAGVSAAWESAKQSDVGQAVGNAVEQGKAKVQEWVRTGKGAALSFLGYDMTKKYDHLSYRMGGKSLNGSIDCSGWSFHVTKMEMESLNQMLGFEKYKIKGNQAGMFNVGMHSAATQIGLTSQKYGVVTDSRTGFDRSKLQAGMMIGQMKKGANYGGNVTDVKGYGKTRYNHIVKVVRGKDGKLYISESQGGSKASKGVTLTELDKWLNMRLKRGDTLTAVNPFGSDIGLLNGNIGDVVVNEAKKAGNAAVSGVKTAYEYGKAGVSNAVAGFRNIIAHNESRGNYNAWNQGTQGKRTIGASGKIDFSKMTLNEYLRRSKLPFHQGKIFAWGKYQMIPDTTRAAIKSMGLSGNELMTPELQERMFAEYLVKKKAGAGKDGVSPLYNFIVGKSDDINGAVNASAKEWASVGVATPTMRKGVKIPRGKSYYAGLGGNAAHTSPDKMAAAASALRNEVAQLAQSRGISREQAYLMLMSPSAARGGAIPVQQPAPRVPKVATAPKPPVATQPIVIKAAATPKQNTANVPAIIASGGRLAHLPLSRNVENQNIAWLASGGIMSGIKQ